MAKARIITLLTDFGTVDPYVAQMKGVLLGMCPAAHIVDITHHVEAHDVVGGAFRLAEAVPYFPPGTVHVAVVDPGVGTERPILAAGLGGHYVVLPDNGLITFLTRRLPLEELVQVRNQRFLPQDPSRTFHGRDIFAPLAGWIANGLGLARLGPRPQTYTLLEIPEPQQQDGALVGQVIYVDHFGNLVSNVSQAHVDRAGLSLERVHVTCGRHEIGPVRGTYGNAEEGRLLTLVNSMGFVEVAVNRGRACDELEAAIGSEIRVFER